MLCILFHAYPAAFAYMPFHACSPFNFIQDENNLEFSCKSSMCRFIGTSGQTIDDLYKYSDAEDKLEFMERALRWRHLGQTIDDLYKYSDAKDKLEFMERALRWRHLAPTAPNSLGNNTPVLSLMLHVCYRDC
jgi:hypothetical protein